MPSHNRSHRVHLQAYAWDWLMSIPEEYAAVKKVGFNAPDIAYFLSRSVIFGQWPFLCQLILSSIPIDSGRSVLCLQPPLGVTANRIFACLAN